MATSKSSRRKHVAPWVLSILTCVSVMFPLAISRAQDGAVNASVEIDQTQLLANQIPLQKVLESGAHFFTTPFTARDGFGEGATRNPDPNSRLGPHRWGQRAFLYPGYVTGNTISMPFLRMNGLDSQSCFECHNNIGSDTYSNSAAKMRKRDAQGGGAGAASNAYINDDFPSIFSTAPWRLTKLVRSPPHAFGSGYTQQLAYEMTYDLAKEYMDAQTKAKAEAGHVASVALTSKGVSFGVFTTTYDASSGTFEDDFSKVQGLAFGPNMGLSSLTVRPFQFKGIAASLRHFVRDALNFHFSIQPNEKFYQNADGTWSKQPDEDQDGVKNEFSEGDVSALSAFAGMLRPPVQSEASASANLGLKIFTGEGKYGGVNGQKVQVCASCHVPRLRLNTPRLFIAAPDAMSDATMHTLLQSGALSASARQFISTLMQPPQPSAVQTRYMPTLTDPDPPARTIVNRLLLARVLSTEGPSVQALSGASTVSGYFIDLTDPGVPEASAIGKLIYDPSSCRKHSEHRLCPAGDGSVEVPLFSDLKLHKMGTALADVASQATDTMGVSVPADEFLTRPLWGVADTGPWLHDGRAITLQSAIEMHESPGSEANEAVEHFNALTANEKQAVVDFLLTLRLPSSN